MSAAYEVRRMCVTLEGRTYAQGETLPGSAVNRLKATSRKHLLDTGRIVLVTDGEEVAAPLAAASVNVRSKRPSNAEVRAAVRAAPRP